ncbi:signal transduction histidine kinase [Allocatelliglobosispora scoriae]|uniref:histidine kinase n=1 Tax=Allocatelliglobosispora scoriae TaxID=643052 RepID=A0A841BYM8_9ACTN|nr:sensor histidine kinase [Allocatelliglobosispora scoriae]MBB5871771.1 signal transduction histidine kinase [Allocatelliglobosispora scoriae]
MKLTIRKAWRATVFVVSGLATGMITFVVALLVAILTLVLCCTVVAAPLGLAVLAATTRVLTSWQSGRFAGLLGVKLAPPVPVGVGEIWSQRAVRETTSPALWRQLGYHLLVAGPVGVLGFGLVVGTASVGLALIASAVPGWSAGDLAGNPGIDRSALVSTLFGVGGVVLLAAAAPIARGIAALDTLAARALLQPSRAELLERRVEQLTESRADVVDAADAERRRIERNLHDGAQQRLVSLAMNLGMARATLTDLDPRARLVIEQAHDEAKQALAELRDLVRGLHPAVLDDRGLDAALSGIAARAPLPVRLTVEVPVRPSRTIEAVAYFVVSEALANVAKHAEASSAEVAVHRDADRLRLTISDDGRGGADPESGTGLRGLAQRIGSVDGTLHIESPPDGPTRIIVELPCES